MNKILLLYLFVSSLCIHRDPNFELRCVCPTEKVSVIINPISGGRDKKAIVEEIMRKVDKKRFEVEILYTKAPKHATWLAKEAVRKGAKIVVVVGGDGSINEVGQALIGTGVALAIIPTGSGNGLARHLKIPSSTSEAIDLINQCCIKKIDTVQINDRYYLGVAGIGFDAEIGWKFATFGHRGFFSYLFLTLKNFPSYKSSSYNLIVDGKKMEKKAFLISFANSSQFGNGVLIAPKAKINDGNLDLIIVEDFPRYAAPKIAFQLFNGSFHHSKYAEIIRCKEIVIDQPDLKAQVDGEPQFFPKGMRIKIMPLSLNVIASSKD